MIVYELLVSNKYMRNHTTVSKLIVFDRNTWYQITMGKQIIIDQKFHFKKCNRTLKYNYNQIFKNKSNFGKNK